MASSLTCIKDLKAIVAMDMSMDLGTIMVNVDVYKCHAQPHDPSVEV
jgi:hypothetical protein